MARYLIDANLPRLFSLWSSGDCDFVRTGSGRHGIPSQSRRMERGPQEAQVMKSSHAIELVREGRYMAEVEVTLIETESEWSPYLSLEDAERLDEVRLALRKGDLKSAARLGRVYELKPIAAE